MELDITYQSLFITFAAVSQNSGSKVRRRKEAWNLNAIDIKHIVNDRFCPNLTGRVAAMRHRGVSQ
jgi:hypothetical protein